MMVVATMATAWLVMARGLLLTSFLILLLTSFLILLLVNISRPVFAHSVLLLFVDTAGVVFVDGCFLFGMLFYIAFWFASVVAVGLKMVLVTIFESIVHMPSVESIMIVKIGFFVAVVKPLMIQIPSREKLKTIAIMNVFMIHSIC
tara:strand:+ start:4256 stop:4693 length:438 start_codon:yes stop_codon:yes gene_type:complete